MFSSLLFPGLGRLAAANPQVDDTSGAASLMALHEAEVVNRSPVLRPSTAADNKQSLAASDSVASIADSKHAKSPLINSASVGTDENLAPSAVEVGNNSTDEVFHTPLITAGSDTSLKFKEAKVIVSTSTQSMPTESSSFSRDNSKMLTESLQIRRGRIEPLGIPVPTTYADATNLASLHPEVAEFILAIPISPNEHAKDSAPQAQAEGDDHSAKSLETQAACAVPYDAHIKSPMNDTAEVHTPSRPNWALAPSPLPEGSPKKKNERRRRGRNPREKAEDLKGPEDRQRQPDTSEKARQYPRFETYSIPKTPTRMCKARHGGARHKVTPTGAQKSEQDHDSPLTGAKKDCSPRKSGTPAPEEASSPGPSQGARSALHLAQVDALIKELQRTRGLLETPPPSAEKNVKDKKQDSAKDPIARASSLPSESSSASVDSKIPWVWVAGHDGVLRPDMFVEGRPSSAPRPARADSPTAFMPAGMQDLYDLPPGLDRLAAADFAPPMARILTPIPPGAIFQAGLVQDILRDSGGPFPPAFEGSSRSTDSKGTIGRRSGRSRSRNRSGQAKIRAWSPEEEMTDWRRSKLPKDTKVIRPNPPSTAGPPISPVNMSRWPTLDEICAQKGYQSSSSA